MKKTIWLLAILISMAACTTKVQQPTQCELFGVHLGMTKEEVGQIITERFGRPEEDMGDYQLEDIYSDGVKYENVFFNFNKEGILGQIYAITQDIDTEASGREWEVLDLVYKEIHRVDSSLTLHHKVYNIPMPMSKDLSNDIVSIASKDIHNTSDIISVRTIKYSYGDYSLVIELTPIEKNKYWN